MTKEFRYRAEQAIIGAVILENCYLVVADCLTVRNFSDWGANGDFRVIWETIVKMQPAPVDILTVCHEIKRRFDLNYIHHLTNAISRVSSSVHLQWWAVMLVEESMREEFGRYISQRLQYKKDSDVLRAGLRDILDVLYNPGIDVFETIENMTGYLESLGADEVLITALQNLEGKVGEKIAAMVRKERLRACLKQIEVAAMDASSDLERPRALIAELYQMLNLCPTTQSKQTTL